jgi:alanyl-tRNA synthetase
MGIALNRIFAPLWKKDPGCRDCFGNPHFDSLAMEKSVIGLLGATDTYRIGKSLRKKGFDREALFAGLKPLEEEVNALLSAWSSLDAPVTMRADGDLLADRRYWSAPLDGAVAEIPCGGTHVKNLAEIGAARAEFDMPDEETLIIRTSVR